MLFRLKHGVDPFELNPGARAVKEFDELTPKQFMFVCLVADVDHDNPLHTLPEIDKRTKAAAIAGYGLEDAKRPDKNARNMIGGKIASVETAITKYRELQFDPDKAQHQALRKQINEIRFFLESDKDALAKKDPKQYLSMLTTAAKLAQELPSLMEAEKALDKMLKAKLPASIDVKTYTAADLTDEDLGDEGEDSLNLIDHVMKKDGTV